MHYVSPFDRQQWVLMQLCIMLLEIVMENAQDKSRLAMTGGDMPRVNLAVGYQGEPSSLHYLRVTGTSVCAYI